MKLDFKKLTKDYREAYPYIKSQDPRQANKDNYIDWNNTMLYVWEFEMLKGIGAITDSGIVCDYPILSITDKNGKETTQDFDGNINSIMEKAEEIKNKGLLSSAKIVYCPRKYGQWINYKKELEGNLQNNKYAEMINTPPVTAYRELKSNILSNINF